MPDYSIKRLNFRLKEFTRHVWVSDQAEEIWSPRLKSVLDYLEEINLQSVAEGIRSVTVKLIDPEEITSITNKYSGYGLKVDLLHKVLLNNKQQSGSNRPDSGESLVKFWAVIGTYQNIQTFKTAFQQDNQLKMSLLQGSPICCNNFFYKMAIEEKFLDLTWPMAVNTVNSLPSEVSEVDSQKNSIGVPPIFQCNTLLKSLGIKAVFHSPCRFNCPATIELADKLFALGKKKGLFQEAGWLKEILSWPVHWSALHGIAEIKNPVLKISTYTDATAEKYTVLYNGTLYPDETARGIVFPYQRPEKLLLTDSKSFKEGLLNNSIKEVT